MSAAFAPWSVSETRYHRDGADWRNITDAEERVVAVVPARVWYGPDASNARLIATAPDGYAVAGKFIMAAINEFEIPENADEGWILDELGHGLGGAYLDAIAYRAKARGEAA